MEGSAAGGCELRLLATDGIPLAGVPRRVRRLEADGFVALPGAIKPALVRAARREINREIGASQAGVGEFKGGG